MTLTVVLPGVVNTDLSSGIRIPFARLMRVEPEAIAEAIVASCDGRPKEVAVPRWMGLYPVVRPFMPDAVESLVRRLIGDDQAIRGVDAAGRSEYASAWPSRRRTAIPPRRQARTPREATAPLATVRACWPSPGKYPSAVLLAAQLAGAARLPVHGGERRGRALFSALGIVILGLVLLAVRSTPALTWVAVLLGVPATVLLVIQAITASDTLLPYSSGIEAVLYFYAAGAMIAYMLADHEITRDELFAIGATFTLVAWGFAYVFIVYQALDPGGFTAAVDPQADRTWMELLFLSVTTLTSTGLSDVVPVEPHARSIVMLEQIAGVSFIAMLVSRLVGLTILGGRAREG